MGAPNLTFTISGNKVSHVSGHDFITVTFKSDIAYQVFECRATKIGEDYGVGKGELISTFSETPANTDRTFEIYDDYLTNGDGKYRISLFAQSKDGNWNDNYGFIPSGSKKLLTSDDKIILCRR